MPSINFCGVGGTADTPGLSPGTSNSVRVQISHPAPKNFSLKVFMDAHNTVTVEEGDRYPLGLPINLHIMMCML